MNIYLPEKEITNDKINTFKDLVTASKTNKVLSCKVIKCNEDYSLQVKIGKFTGTIDYKDLELNPENLKKHTIIKMVGHYVKAVIIDLRKDENGVEVKLSRALCQKMCKESYIDKLVPGQVIPVCIDGINKYGIFCDIACGFKALIHPSDLCMMPVIDMNEQLQKCTKLYVVVKDIDDETGKILLSHKELLGTWDEEAEQIKQGEVIIGTIINKTDFGVFISIGQNLKGVADIDENSSELEPGDKVSVYIKNINRSKMKIRLNIIEVIEKQSKEPITFKYYITDGTIDTWNYSPEGCEKEIKTIFRENKN